MKKVVVGTKGEAINLKRLLQTRLLIQANSGKGKSFLLRRLAEQLYGQVQVIIIDPEGEFSTLREKFGYVLVGKGGETPADPRSAAMVAHKLLELHASAVCDIFELKPSERHRWVKLFLEAMVDAPKELWHPVVVILDEAHVYVPEKGAGESEASEAVISIGTRGRKRGFCLILATQRIGKMRKDVVAEMLNVMIGGTFLDIDRKRAADALGVYGKDTHPFFDKIKMLERGKFYSLGPAISEETKIIQIAEVKTTHPESGTGKYSKKFPLPKEIKKFLPKLADLPKQAEEKAHTEAEYQKEIRSLKAQLVVAQRTPAALPIQIDSKRVKKLEDIIKSGREENNEIKKFNNELNRKINMHIQGLAAIAEKAASLANMKIPTFKFKPATPLILEAPMRPEVKPITAHVEPKRKLPLLVEPTPRRSFSESSNGDVKLPPGAQRILKVIATNSGGVFIDRIVAQAMVRGGSLTTYLSMLRTKGLITESGGLFMPTQDGSDAAETILAIPSTTEEVVSLWKDKLPPGANRILDALVERGGALAEKEEISEAAQVRGGSFNTYLSTLRGAGLVTGSGSQIAANKENLLL